MVKNNNIIRVRSSIDGKVVFDIETLNDNLKFELEIFDMDYKCVYTEKGNTNSRNFKIEFNIDKPTLWLLKAPYLYSYKLKLNEEVFEEKFGFRKIATSGKYVTLNDFPLFIRGYIRGIAAHDHNNNCNLTEEEFYRKNIKTAKKFGFNLVRFHSTVPSETFFKVADEEGILVHIEMRPPKDGYNNLTEMIDTRTDFINKDFILETMNKYFNHPSLAVYCLGNEFKDLGQNESIRKIGEFIKSFDSSRLYIDTCAWGENNRPLVDIDVQHMSYYFPFGKHADMYDDVKNLQIGEFNKGREIVFNVPLIAHEVCHYVALRDFENLRQKFANFGVKEPWWVNEELKMIEAKGYKDIYPEMYKASKYFQRNSWKIAYEAMRRSKLLGGYMFLQLADTDMYENSNGIIDCFDDINGIKPEEFNIFNGDILLLTKLEKYNYFDNEDFSFDVNISRFDERNLNKAKLIVHLGNQKQIFNDVDISKHDFYKLLSVSFKFEKVNVKTKLDLRFELYDEDNIISSNSYNIWVYPSLNKISYNEFINYREGNKVITDSIEVALKSLKEGKNVILVYRNDFTRHVRDKSMKNPEYAFKASWNRFKPVIWDRGTNFGGIYNDKISTYGFDKYLDLDLSITSEDCDKVILDNFPVKVTNLISGIDKCNRDRFDAYKTSFNLPELMYDRTLRNYSYLFGLNIGKSKLVVTGLNLTGLDNNEASSNYIANMLLKLLDELIFESSISVESLEAYLKECAKEPVKERMMTQFWALDDAPVESKEFWTESRAYLTK